MGIQGKASNDNYRTNFERIFGKQLKLVTCDPHKLAVIEGDIWQCEQCGELFDAMHQANSKIPPGEK